MNVNLGQIPERSGRDGEREIGRINHKQAMLEHFQRENLNKSSGTAQAATLNSGDLDLSFNPTVIADNAAVEAIVPMPDGKTLVGGSFNSYNGTARNNLLRLNADGTLDNSFAAEIGGNVWAVTPQSDGKILVGGTFTSVNGVGRGNVVRLNSDGTLDTTFDFITGTDLTVYDVKIQSDGKIIIGGAFTTVNGTPRSRIARLNSDGSLDATFDAGNGPNNLVYRLAIQADGKIIITGLFNEFSGTRRMQLARLNADGTLDTTFFNFNNINFFGGVGYDVVVQPDGKILVAGFFQGYFLRLYLLVRLNPSDGALDTSFQFISDDSTENYIEQVALQPDGKMIVGGFFSFNSTSVIRNISRLNANGTIDTTFNPGGSTNSSVEAVSVQTDGKVLIGGLFTTYRGTSHNRFARLNVDGSSDTSFDMGSGFIKEEPGVVYATAVQTDGKILIGGVFQRVNGVIRNNIARLNADGSLDTSFNPGNGTQFLPGTVNPVYTIALEPDNQIVIAGLFPTYNNQFVDNIVRLQSNGSWDDNFLPFTDGAVRKVLILPDDYMLIVGDFRYVNNFSNGRIARLDDIGEVDFKFNVDSSGNPNSGANSNIYDITLQADGKILIAGQYTSYNGVTRNRIARLLPDGLLDTTFAPNGGANATVWSVTPQTDGKVLIAGSFTAINGQPRNGVARLNADGTLDTTFAVMSGTNGVIYDLLPLSNGKFLIGGEFTTLNSVPRNSLARLNADGSLDATYASGTDGYIRSISPYPNDKAVIGGFFSSVNGVSRSRVARLSPLNMTTQPRTLFDFDGDRKTDVAIFRPTTGAWWIMQSGNSQIYAVGFGNSTDRIVPADFTGDGKTDMAFFRESTGEWFVLRSDNNTFYGFPFGSNGDKAVPADFDGDGKADPTVFRPSNSGWYSLLSSNGSVLSRSFGVAEDVPLPNDYDGDGKADLGIFRPSTSAWWIQKSNTGAIFAAQFGQAGDKPAPADFTGDGKTDVAFFRPSNSTWYVLRSEDSSFYGFPFGASNDIPVVGDYDGDGKADAAVFRASDNGWYLLRSTAGFTAVTFGAAADKPIPSAYLP